MIDAAGYWEPHTSSVDFCESNYLHSSYVAEIHNVWSSLLGITSWGVLGLWQTYTRTAFPLREIRTRIAFSLLILIGIGSMGLHGTLHWIFQSSDELPMLYAVLCGAFAVLHVDDDANDTSLERRSARRTAVWFAFGLAFVNTVFYYTLQHVYAVFLVTFSGGTYLVLRKIAQLTTRCKPETAAVAWRGMLVFVLIASPVWVLDMLVWCGQPMSDAPQPTTDTTGARGRTLLDTVSNVWLGGMTPHVLWHFCAGLGAYCFVLFVAACRCDILRIPITIQCYCAGVVPVIIDEKSRDKKISVD